MNLWHELTPGLNPPEVIYTIVEIPKYLFNNNLGFCGRGVHLIPHSKLEVIS